MITVILPLHIFSWGFFTKGLFFFSVADETFSFCREFCPFCVLHVDALDLFISIISCTLLTGVASWGFTVVRGCVGSPTEMASGLSWMESRTLWSANGFFPPNSLSSPLCPHHYIKALRPKRTDPIVLGTWNDSCPFCFSLGGPIQFG